MITEFLIAYGFIFLSELGDKTQLMAISLQMKYKNRWTVLVGVSLGLTLVMGIGLVIGFVLKQSLNRTMINIVAGLIFLVAALFQLKEILTTDENAENIEAKDSDNEHAELKNLTVTLSENSVSKVDNKFSKESMTSSFNGNVLEIIGKVASLMFLAELGDKTQIVFVSLVASQSDFILTTIGGLLALLSVNAIGILFADVLTRYINVKVLNWIVFILFVLFGSLLLAEAFGLVTSNIF